VSSRVGGAASNDESTRNARTRRNARVAVRLTADAKDTLERAAEITGRSLSDFVVASAVTAARRTIEETVRMRLAERDRAAFLEALANPPAPSKALRSAARRYDRLVK